ncbi:MAG: prolipoprotein diacylglyceryl transferase, partial [Actinomycetota bacterium]|nr:prolipoprotein diacylglyceryl transferase [Actinomycetota bacterium]
KTTLPWGLEVYLRTPGGAAGTFQDCVAAGAAPEFPTAYIKASPTVLCGTFHPTFLYELIWDLLVAALIVWADKRFKLGGGRVFALYVAGYTAGRAWIEALRIDPARTRIFGLRVNIVVAIVLFGLAVIYLVWRWRKGREDPAVVAGQLPDGERGADVTTVSGAADRSRIDAGGDAEQVGGDGGDRQKQPVEATTIVQDPVPSEPMPPDPVSSEPAPPDPLRFEPAPSTDPEPPAHR